MRAIKFKYAIALNLSVVDNEIWSAIEQAKEVSKELDIPVCLTNPLNGKYHIFQSWDDSEKIFNRINENHK